MPDRRVESAARDHVHELRHRDYCPTELGPDEYILGPLMRRLDDAVADILEYHLDIQGGTDGIKATFDRLCEVAHQLPGLPDWVPSTSPVRPEVTIVPLEELRPRPARGRS